MWAKVEATGWGGGGKQRKKEKLTTTKGTITRTKQIKVDAICRLKAVYLFGILVLVLVVLLLVLVVVGVRVL